MFMGSDETTEKGNVVDEADTVLVGEFGVVESVKFDVVHDVVEFADIESVTFVRPRTAILPKISSNLHPSFKTE